MVKPPDHLGDDFDDSRMAVAEHRRHLAAREVEDPPSGGVLHERAVRPLGEEGGEGAAVADEVAPAALETRQVGRVGRFHHERTYS